MKNQNMLLILVFYVLGLKADTSTLITSGSSNNETLFYQPGEIDALQNTFLNSVNEELDLKFPHCKQSEMEAYLNSLLEECGDLSIPNLDCVKWINDKLEAKCYNYFSCILSAWSKTSGWSTIWGYSSKYDKIINCGKSDRSTVNSTNLSKACKQANKNCGSDKRCIADQVKQMNDNGMYRFCGSYSSISVTNGHWAYYGYGVSDCQESAYDCIAYCHV